MTERKLATTTSRATAELRTAVRRARNSAGLSQEEAALDMGVSHDSVSRWENGDARPDFAKLLDAPKMGPAFSAELERLLAARRAA